MSQEDLAKITQAVLSLYESADSNVQHQASGFLEKVKQDDNLRNQFAFPLVKSSSPFVSFYGLNLLKHSVMHGWANLGMDANTFCQELMSSSLSCSPTSPRFLLTKFGEVLVETAKRIWPQMWPDFTPFLFSLFDAPFPQMVIGLSTLRLLADEIVLFGETLPPKRGLEMRSELKHQMGNIFQSLIQRFHQHHELYVQTNEEAHAEIVELVIRCFQAYISWCPEEMFLKNQDDVDVLLRPLAILVGHRNKKLRDAAKETLEVVLIRRPESPPLTHALFVCLPFLAQALHEPPPEEELEFRIQVFQLLSEYSCFGILDPKNRENMNEKEWSAQVHPVNSELFFNLLVAAISHPSCGLYEIAIDLWHKMIKGKRPHPILVEEGVVRDLLSVFASRCRKLSYSLRLKTDDLPSDVDAPVWKSILHEDLDKKEYSKRFGIYIGTTVPVIRFLASKHPLLAMTILKENLVNLFSTNLPYRNSWSPSNPEYIIFVEKLNGLVRFLEPVCQRVNSLAKKLKEDQLMEAYCFIAKTFIENAEQFVQPPDPQVSEETAKCHLAIATQCLIAFRAFDSFFERESSLLLWALRIISSFLLGSNQSSHAWRRCRHRACCLLVHFARNFPNVKREVHLKTMKCIHKVNVDVVGEMRGELVTLTCQGLSNTFIMGSERNHILQAVVATGRASPNYGSFVRLFEELLADGLVQWESPGLQEVYSNPTTLFKVAYEPRGFGKMMMKEASLFPPMGFWKEGQILFTLVPAFLTVFQEVKIPWKSNVPKQSGARLQEILRNGDFLAKATSPPPADGSVATQHPFHPTLARILPGVLRLMQTIHVLWHPEFRASVDPQLQFMFSHEASSPWEDPSPEEDDDIRSKRASLQSLRQNVYGIFQMTFTSPGHQELYLHEGICSQLFDCIFSTIRFMEDRHLVALIRRIIYPFFQHCPKPLLNSVAAPYLSQFFQYMFDYFEARWLQNEGGEENQASSQLFGTPTDLFSPSGNPNIEETEVIRDQFKREVLQTFMGTLSASFTLVDHSKREQEKDKEEKGIDALQPFAQYILLTPDLLLMLLRQCCCVFRIKDTPTLFRTIELLSVFLPLVFRSALSGAYNSFPEDTTKLLLSFLSGHLLSSIIHAIQDHRNRSAVPQLINLVRNLLSHRISDEGDRISAEVLMGLPHSPSLEAVQSLFSLLRGTSTTLMNQKKSITNFLEPIIGLSASNFETKIRYPPLAPLNIKKPKKPEEESDSFTSIKNLFQ